MAIGSNRPSGDEPEGRGWLFKAVVGLILFVVGLPLLGVAAIQIHRQFETPQERALEDQQNAAREKAAAEQEASKQAAHERDTWETANILMAKDRMRAALKDPDSARFGNVWIEETGIYNLKLPGTVCGQVNARNSFGGYTGLKDFIVVAGIPMAEDGSGGFIQLWNKHCVTKAVVRKSPKRRPS